MLAIRPIPAMLLMSLFVTACGSQDKPPEPPPVEETVFRDVAVAPVEKARNVQNVVDEQKRALDQAVERSESDQ